MDRELIWNGRDNPIMIGLKSNGAYVNLSSVTHMEVVFSTGVTISSAVSPALFSGVTNPSGIVTLLFGSAGLAAGAHQGDIIVYDATNDDGIVYGSVLFVVK